MIDLFSTAMSFVWQPQFDGQGFHNSANDPGGSTSWGVTFTTWAGWQRLHNAPVSMALFKSMAKDAFLPLYRSMFWNSVRCGNMGAIGVQVFDASVNSGPDHAARFLQSVLKVEVDGQVGPRTLAALNNSNPAAVNQALMKEREAFYAASPNAIYFERGWDNRAEACQAFVAKLLQTPTPAPSPAPIALNTGDITT